MFYTSRADVQKRQQLRGVASSSMTAMDLGVEELLASETTRDMFMRFCTLCYCGDAVLYMTQVQNLIQVSCTAFVVYAAPCHQA
jgi:hypothetical protein